MEVNPLADDGVVGSTVADVPSLAAAEMKSEVVTLSAPTPPSATPTVFEEPSSTTTPPRSSQHNPQSQSHSNASSARPHSTPLSSHSGSTETCVPDSTTSFPPAYSTRREKMPSADSGYSSRLQSLDSGHNSRLHSLDSEQVSGLHCLDLGQNSCLQSMDSGNSSQMSSVDLEHAGQLPSVNSGHHPSSTVFRPLSRHGSSSNSAQPTPNPAPLVSALSDRTGRSAGADRSSSGGSGLPASLQSWNQIEMQQCPSQTGTTTGNQSPGLNVAYASPALFSAPVSSSISSSISSFSSSISSSSAPSLSSPAAEFPGQRPQIPPNPPSLPRAPPSLTSTPPSLPPPPPSIVTHSLSSSSSIIPSLLPSNAFLHDPVSAHSYSVRQDPVITGVPDLVDVPSQMYPAQSVNRSAQQSAHSQGGQFDLYTGQPNQPVYNQHFQSGQVFDGRAETRLQHFEIFSHTGMGRPVSATPSQYSDPYIKHEPGAYPNSCQFTNAPLAANTSVPLHHQMGQQRNQNLGQSYNFGQQNNFQENGSFVNTVGTQSVPGTGYQQNDPNGHAPAVAQFQQPQSGNSMPSAPLTNTVPPPNQTIFGTSTPFGPFGGLQSGPQFAPSQNPTLQSQNTMTSSGIMRDATATVAPQPTNQIPGLPLLTREDLRMLDFVEQLDPGTSVRDMLSFS